MENTTWRKLIEGEMEQYGEVWSEIVAQAFAPSQRRYDDHGHVLPLPFGVAWYDVEFDPGFGGAEGCYFTVWTAKRVYFPCEYDGAEYVRSAPRDPCDEAMEHV